MKIAIEFTPAEVEVRPEDVSDRLETDMPTDVEIDDATNQDILMALDEREAPSFRARLDREKMRTEVRLVLERRRSHE